MPLTQYFGTVWERFEVGQWGIARHAYESGLRCSPQHYIIQNKLLEVLLQLADWQAISSVLDHILRQNPANVRAVKVFSAISGTDLAVQRKRPCTSQTGASESHDELAQLQPQLKCRKVIHADFSSEQMPLQHSINPSAVTWQSVSKALAGSLRAAADKGLPAACNVLFFMPDALNMGSETGMVASPPAADASASQAEAGSLVLDLGKSDDLAAANVSEQPQQDETEAARSKPGPVPAALPQRASRRLGSSRAVTEASSDHESPEPTKNLVELLAPFLAPQLLCTGSQPDSASDALHTAGSTATANSSQQPLEQEAHSVCKFIEQHHGKSGLYAVAVALLDLILGGQAVCVLSSMAQELMDLEILVRGWCRSPAVSLALAELYFHAAVEQSLMRDSSKKTKSSAWQSQHEQLLQGCTANVGMFESALFQQQLSLSVPASVSSALAHTEAAGAATQPAHSVNHLLVRYHWLGACVSQHLKRFKDAAQQYEACKAGLTMLTQTPKQARYTEPVPAGAPAISAELVDTRLDALKLIIVVQDGRKCLDEGRHLELVSHLAPVLLASNTSKVPLDVAQQLVGLDLLQEASTGPDAWQLHLQCLLAKASTQLPPQPQGKTLQQSVADPQLLPTHAHFAVMNSLSDTISAHLPDWQQKLKAADGTGAGVLDDLLAKLQWQVLGVVRTLYCSLARSSSANSPTRKTLDVKEQQQQLGLLHAFQLLLTLRQLDSRLSFDQHTQVQLLSTGAGIFVDTAVIGLAHGSYLKTCLMLLAPFFTDIAHQCHAHGAEMATEPDVSLVGAAAQCIHLLYGLELPERDAGFTDGFQGKTDRQDPQTHEEALCVWTYLSHFGQNLTNRSKSFIQRLGELLAVIQEKVGPPPDSVLALFDLDALLDGALPATFNTSASAIPLATPLSWPGSGSQQSDAQATGSEARQSEAVSASLYSVDFLALQEAVQQDPDSALHSQLYHLLAQCQPDVSDQITESVMMQQAGHDQILQYLRITHFDLCYHPKRYESWERTLNTYLTAASSLASIAANHVATQFANEDVGMTPEGWQERLHLQQRFKLYSSRALAAIAYAQLAAADISDAQERSGNLAFLEEQKGSLLLEQIQNAPPMYDQMRHSPDRHAAVYQHACRAGLEAFQRAQLILPEEWTFQLCIAKMLRKLHKQPGQVLHHLALACMLAKQMVGGSVEALYQLHAMRLKLLQEQKPDMQLLGRHCFLPQTLSALLLVNSAQERSQLAGTSASLSSMSASASSSQWSDGADLIYEDAMSAMAFCLEQSKQHSRNGSYETFHKAHYRRAQALRWKGQQEQALAELQPFFKGKARHGLVVNMFIIPDGVKKAAKAYAALDSGAAEDTAADEPKAAVPEEQWGHKVASLANNGIEESPRKFRAHVRRALVLYVLLLRDTKDLDALRGVVTTLRTSSFVSYADIGRWACGMYVIHLAAALQHLQVLSPEPAESGSLAPPAVAPATLLPGAHFAGDQLGPQLVGAATSPSASPVDTDLLEKAYQLYQDTCLSSDPLHSWAGHVEDSLRAAQTFHAPNMRELLGSHAISPEMFCKFAIVYIHTLGVAGSADKLSSIQQTTKRQLRRSNASAEACQLLYTAAAAALQVAYDKELCQLESSIQRALQDVLQEHAAELAVTRPEDEVSEAPSADPAAVSLAPHGDNQPNVEAQPSSVDTAEPMEIATQPDQAGSAVIQVLHKELLLGLLGLLRKLLASWKALGSKGVDLLQGSTIRADAHSSNLLSRAYTAYLRLSFPSEAFTPVPASGAATAVELLLQQVKSGIQIPKPAQPEVNAPEAEAIPHIVQAPLN
ncbi:TPA: Calcineurin-binding protein cabin-1, variant 3 [Trebouxia sp. C0004]